MQVCKDRNYNLRSSAELALKVMKVRFHGRHILACEMI